MVNRVLLIGSGGIGRRHLAVLRATLPGVPVTLLRRPNAPELDHAVAAEIERAVDDIAAALVLRPDFAVIASPATSHIRFALDLAAAGIPMLIEKPLSVDLTGCAELGRLCRAKSLPVLIGYTMRYHPGFIAFAEHFQAGAVGRPVSLRAEVGQHLPDWRPGTDYRQSVTAQCELGGGALLELSHEIDLVRALLGMPQTIQAHFDRLGDLDIDVEDTVDLVMRHQTGKLTHAVASIHLDLLQRPARRRLVLCGTESTLELDFITGRLQQHRPDGSSQDLAFSKPADRNTLYAAELADLLQAIRGGATPRVGLVDGIATQSIIEAARRAAETGGTIAVTEAA